MAQEPSGLRCGGFAPPSALLIPTFALRFAPPVLPRGLLRYSRTLPYRGTTGSSVVPPAASVVCLSPGTLSARRHSTSELLRTLSRMAASKPTSWLSLPPHYLVHSADTWGPELAIWVVPLSATKVSPRRLTRGPLTWAFAVWLGLVTGKRPRAHPVPYLPGSRSRPRLYLHTFRGEPAISGFDWNFSPIHRSSPCFATQVGSGLDAVLPTLHPAHG